MGMLSYKNVHSRLGQVTASFNFIKTERIKLNEKVGENYVSSERKRKGPLKKMKKR